MSTKFEISITSWTSQVRGNPLPICQLVSTNQIDARIESMLYSSEKINSVCRYGKYVTSAILWPDARIYAKIGAINVIIVNFGSFIGCFLYSMLSDFSVGPLRAENTQGVFHAFMRIDDGEVVVVNQACK